MNDRIKKNNRHRTKRQIKSHFAIKAVKRSINFRLDKIADNLAQHRDQSNQYLYPCLMEDEQDAILDVKQEMGLDLREDQGFDE